MNSCHGDIGEVILNPQGKYPFLLVIQFGLCLLWWFMISSISWSYIWYTFLQVIPMLQFSILYTIIFTFMYNLVLHEFHVHHEFFIIFAN